MFADRLSEEPIELVGAKINSFHWDKTGQTRHDVLMMLSKKDTARIEEMRKIVRIEFPELHKKFGMHEPHVTHLADAGSLEAAQEALKAIKPKFPLKVNCIGSTWN